MRQVIQKKEADMICVARPIVYNPNFPKQILNGLNTPSKCLNCNICLAVVPRGYPTKCYNGRAPY